MKRRDFLKISACLPLASTLTGSVVNAKPLPVSNTGTATGRFQCVKPNWVAVPSSPLQAGVHVREVHSDRLIEAVNRQVFSRDNGRGASVIMDGHACLDALYLSPAQHTMVVRSINELELYLSAYINRDIIVIGSNSLPLLRLENDSSSTTTIPPNMTSIRRGQAYFRISNKVRDNNTRVMLFDAPETRPTSMSHLYMASTVSIEDEKGDVTFLKRQDGLLNQT